MILFMAENPNCYSPASMPVGVGTVGATVVSMPVSGAAKQHKVSPIEHIYGDLKVSSVFKFSCF